MTVGRETVEIDSGGLPMVLRLGAVLLGGHRHVRVFGGPDVGHLALCGSLVFTEAEWDFLKGVLLSHPGREYDPAHDTLTISGGGTVEIDS